VFLPISASSNIYTISNTASSLLLLLLRSTPATSLDPKFYSSSRALEKKASIANLLLLVKIVITLNSNAASALLRTLDRLCLSST
jgi:hypothetical protein